MPTVPGAWRRWTAFGAGLLGDDGVSIAPTIFAEMSHLAAETELINLGQGFPDEDGPAEVLEAAQRAIADGHNSTRQGAAFRELLEAISEHQNRFYGLSVDPATEVLATTGATEALSGRRCWR